MNEHVVRQGEHLSRIAEAYGFADSLVIWNHPGNAALKAKRKNPNVLLEGDVLVIPPRASKETARATEQTHRFTVNRSPLMLRLQLEDALFRPIAGAHCVLSVQGQVFKLVTDGHGRLTQEIPVAAETAQLVITEPQSPLDGQEIPILIGHLNPIDEVSGQKARLNNLGYFAGPADHHDEALFRSAVEEFQCDHLGRAAVDGTCGPKTQAKLRSVYGC